MKQLAIILVLALLICTCGCQPASLSGGPSTEPSTEPSKTEPSVDVPATEPSQSALDQDGENVQPAVFEYIVLDEEYGPYAVNCGEQFVAVIRSAEEFKDTYGIDSGEIFDEKIEGHEDRLLTDYSVIIISYYFYEPNCAIPRVVGVSETDDGGYQIDVELCEPDIETYPSVVSRAVWLLVNRYIPEGAVIDVKETSAVLPVDEFDAYFGTVNGEFATAGKDC